MMSKLYRQTELTNDEMDTYAFPHVLAMTGEKLHSKAEIAEELGARDKRIKELEQEVADLDKGQSSFLALLELLPCLEEPLLFLSYWTEGRWELCHEWDDDINEINPKLFVPLFEAEQQPEVK